MRTVQQGRWLTRGAGLYSQFVRPVADASSRLWARRDTGRGQAVKGSRMWLKSQVFWVMPEQVLLSTVPGSSVMPSTLQSWAEVRPGKMDSSWVWVLVAAFSAAVSISPRPLWRCSSRRP